MPNVYYFKQTNYNFSRNSTMQIILLQARTLCITTIKLISICLWGVMIHNYKYPRISTWKGFVPNPAT